MGFSNPYNFSISLPEGQIASQTWVDDQLPESRPIASEAYVTEHAVTCITPYSYGGIGDGVADDRNAIQAALNAAYDDVNRRGQVVCIPSGMWRISGPLIVPPFVTLRGSYPMRGTNTQTSCIKATASFAGSAMVLMVDQATGGYSGVSYGQRIECLSLDGSAAKAAGAVFSGVRADGLVKGVALRDVSVDAVGDRGIHTTAVASVLPYSWNLENVQVSNVGVDGFRLSGTTDTTLIGCRSIGAGRHGYNLDGMANSSFTACRSEWSTQEGWHITGSWGSGNGSGGAIWEGCSTDRSEKDGFRIESTGTPPMTFSGCYARRDGRNGGVAFGGTAGFQVVAATTPVILAGCVVFPGTDDDGTGANSPQSGVRVASSTWACLDASYIHGANAHVVDGGGNGAFLIGSTVGRATGTTAAPVRS
jgi:hypothetical protein